MKDLKEKVILITGATGCGRFTELPEDAFEKTMAINLLAPMRLTREFLPGMIERRRGHIVNILSFRVSGRGQSHDRRFRTHRARRPSIL